MISNSNELNLDSLDSESNNRDDPDSGFELDKLEIPKLPPASKTETEADAVQVKKSQAATQSEALPETVPPQSTADAIKRKKAPKGLLILIISGGLIICLCMIGFIVTKLVQPISGTVHSGNTDLGVYQSIAPIVTNLGDSNYVYIILQLRSPTRNNQQFMAFESKVKDTVFGFLGSTDFQRQIAHGGTAKVKSVLYNELGNLLEENYPNQAILSEVRLN